MPNPFSNKPEKRVKPQPEGVVVVENSTLICEVCFDDVHDGLYYPSNKRLVFTCSNGHDNVVKGIEI